MNLKRLHNRGAGNGADAVFGSASFFVPFSDLGAGQASLVPARGAGSATFTRTTTATTILSTGAYTNVGTGVPRSCYIGLAGTYLGYLSEPASTNLVLRSEALATAPWVDVGTPTFAAGAKTCGTLSLDLLGDDDPAAAEGKSQPVTFTADAVKAVSVHISQGTATSLVIQLRDATAVADRLLVVVGWSGGNPVVNAVTGTHIVTKTLANGVFRLEFATTSVTAANSNVLFLYPANDGTVTLTGNTYFGGIQAENSVFCTSYIPTVAATVTRNADVVFYPDATNVLGTVGACYAEVTVFGTTGGNRVVAAPQGATYMLFLDSTNRPTIFDGTSGIGTGVAIPSSAVAKMASSWSGATKFIQSGGVSNNNAFDGDIGPPSNIRVGCDGGAVHLNGCVKNLRCWTRALNSGDLITITT